MLNCDGYREVSQYRSRVTTLPTWALYAVSFGSPVLAFAGAFLGHVLARRTAAEQETRSQREEIMRTLRWAADLALQGDEASAAVGVRTLRVLGSSALLQPDQQMFIDSTIAAILRPAEQRYPFDQKDVDVAVEEGDDE